MIAARAAMLTVAALLVLAAIGSLAREVQASALRVEVTAVVGLLTPLAWPGIAATPARTALRMGIWSVASACLAGAVIWLLGPGAQPWPRILASGAMLAVIMLPALGAAALLEAHWRRVSRDAAGARESAGRAVALTLALLGSLPLWLGPVAELLSADHEWALDAVIGASPLTHLAVASGNDLLRNQWIYQVSNLAALQFSYPGLVDLAWFYGLATLVLAALAYGLARRTRAGADSNHFTTEKVPS